MGGNYQKTYSARPSDYKLLDEIGLGASATVYKAIYLPSNEVVAVKCLDLDRCNSNLDDIRREAQTMSLIDHPNTIRACSSFVVDSYLWVVMPFMAQGSCLHLMQTAYPDGFEEAAICSVLKETLKALNYLHKQGHIHRDVKAGNILLDDNGVVKLADFGVSACMFDTGERQRARNTFVGTPCWMAPEVLQPGSGYNSKADIWSFGITALELAHGHAPFSKYPPMKVLLMTIQNAPPSLDYERDKKFSKSFKEMVAMCLVKDQTKRPTAEKLLKHSCFKNAKPPEVSVKHLFANLPPLTARVKTLKQKDAAQLAEKKMPSAEEEAISKSEYQRGVSAWNFDVEDLKTQASLVEDDMTEAWEYEESLKASPASKVNCIGQPSCDESSSDCLNKKGKVPETDIAEYGCQEKFGSVTKGRFSEAIPSISEQEILQTQTKTARGRQTQSGPLVPGAVLSHSSTERSRILDRSENENHQPQKEKIRKAPSFSGPLMLPNRASANSLSAPIKPSGGFRDTLDDKSKANLVQIKGRFSVTSENLDLVKDIPLSTAVPRRSSQGSSLRKSASVGDWMFDSKSPPNSQVLKESSTGSVPASFVMPHLQNLLQQTSSQQDLIVNMMNSLQSTELVDVSQIMKLPSFPRGSENNGTAEIVASEREQLLAGTISSLQARMNTLTNELDAERFKSTRLQQRLKSLTGLEEIEVVE